MLAMQIAMRHAGDFIVVFGLIVGLLYVAGFQNSREDNR